MSFTLFTWGYGGLCSYIMARKRKPFVQRGPSLTENVLLGGGGEIGFYTAGWRHWTPKFGLKERVKLFSGNSVTAVHFYERATFFAFWQLEIVGCHLFSLGLQMQWRNRALAFIPTSSRKKMKNGHRSFAHFLCQLGSPTYRSRSDSKAELTRLGKSSSFEELSYFWGETLQSGEKVLVCGCEKFLPALA